MAAADQSVDLDGFSGEWPMNWSLASYEDCKEFYHRSVLKNQDQASAKLADVMSRDLTTVTPALSLSDIKAKFQSVPVSGFPVVDGQQRLIGVLSKRDLNKGGERVEDVMTSPPIAANPDTRVADAAALMLKYDVHRIPVVDEQAKVVGMITRSDILKAVTQEAARR
jgi:CBS domain-containing protein